MVVLARKSLATKPRLGQKHNVGKKNMLSLFRLTLIFVMFTHILNCGQILVVMAPTKTDMALSDLLAGFRESRAGPEN